jgi:ferrous iron transport protein B
MVMFLIYVIGIIMALIAALVMKSTLFKGDGEVYLMELPPYRMPTLKSLALHMWDRSKMYLHKAGTIILAASIILYICNTFPEKKAADFSKNYDAEIAAIQSAGKLGPVKLLVAEHLPGLSAEQVAEVKKSAFLTPEHLEAVDMEKLNPVQKKLVNEVSAAHEAVAELENAKKAELMAWTISGRVGHALVPFMKPIGFDWHVTTATIGALAAKEVFVSQLGILFAQGEADENSEGLRAILIKNYTPLQAFCMMLFCLLSIPCLATLAIIKRELNSWKMAIAEGCAMFALAYIVSFIVYQAGMLLNIGTKMLS